MKRRFREPYNPTPAKLRKDDAPIHKKDKEFSVDDKLIGQHGGELVLFRPLSSSDEGLMGLIVQGTHVCFIFIMFCQNSRLLNSTDVVFNYKYIYLLERVFNCNYQNNCVPIQSG